MASDGRPPYFPFYPSDFSSDGIVEAMRTSSVGAYILLLCKAWCEEPPGSIPDDDTVLARWARLSPVDWEECKSEVLAAFTLGTDGRLHQKRLRFEYNKFRERKNKQAESGRRGADVRWGAHGDPIGVAIATPMAKDSLTTTYSSSYSNTTTTEVPGSKTDPAGNVVVVDEFVSAILRGVGISENQIPELARKCDQRRAKCIIEEGQRRVSLGKFAHGGLAGFVSKAIRENWKVPDDVMNAKLAADNRQEKVSDHARKLKAAEAEREAATKALQAEVEAVKALPAAKLAELKARAVAGQSNDRLRAKWEKADPITNAALCGAIYALAFPKHGRGDTGPPPDSSGGVAA